MIDRRTLVGGMVGAGFTPCRLTARPSRGQTRIWDRGNLFAWTVAPFDAVDRDPEQRVAMLARLGLRSYAYSWRPKHVPTFDRELAALRRHRIDLIGWNMLTNEIEDESAIASLEAIRRSGFTPRLWLNASPAGMRARVRPFLPPGMAYPDTEMARRALTGIQTEMLQQAYKVFVRSEMSLSPADHKLRVELEAERIGRIVAIGRTYGCKVALYNHNGWFGMVENQLEIIAKLAAMNVHDVGIVYNFSHSRDEWHDDTKHFPALWSRMKRHVVAVNVTGIHWEGKLIYPSQGDSELAMMRTIEASGWRGPVGIIAENGGDAEVTLRNYLKGVEWLAAEITATGAGGPRPFPQVTPVHRPDPS